ncbi:MAG: tetratricopeptide repeat protein [Gemmatimonadaceae bacterium]
MRHRLHWPGLDGGRFACAALALLWLATPAAAQVAPFPRLVSATTEAGALCSTAPALPSPATAGTGPSAAGRDSAAALAEAAAVATLAGEPERARDQLRQATALDPSSAEIAFRLARVAEDLGDAELATAAYCRLRDTAGDSAQVAEAIERVEALAVDRGLLPPEPALGRFQRGVSDAAAGALPAAERAFDEALTRAPAFAIAYYDRALVRLARGRTREAADDLDRFAKLTPAAVGRELNDVRTLLERGNRSTAAALAWGVVPGGSQFYTGRPWLGGVVAAAAAAGVVMAVQQETRMEERRFVDPFGIPYTDLVPVKVHPRRTLGLAVAGGATLVGAMEGAVFVSVDRGAVSRLVSRVRAALSEQPSGSTEGDGRP